jgi:hypothetical protein
VAPHRPGTRPFELRVSVLLQEAQSRSKSAAGGFFAGPLPHNRGAPSYVLRFTPDEAREENNLFSHTGFITFDRAVFPGDLYPESPTVTGPRSSGPPGLATWDTFPIPHPRISVADPQKTRIRQPSWRQPHHSPLARDCGKGECSPAFSRGCGRTWTLLSGQNNIAQQEIFDAPGIYLPFPSSFPG